MSKFDMILKLLNEFKPYVYLLLPALLALHIPAPVYKKKKDHRNRTWPHR